MSANRRKIRRGRKILRKPDNIQVGKSINRRFSPASLISIPNDAKISNILIQNDAQFSNEISNEIEAHTVAAPVEEETEQFIPTVFTICIIIIIIICIAVIQIHHQVRTFATTTPRPSTRRTTPQPVDDFEDFFDSENDLFVASSTVSSVVFKGSPTPGGWASSPAPNFDGSGVQVMVCFT